MSRASDLKYLLKRGALIAAANWPVVVLQFLAEATFKLLLAVPVIGAAFLVALLVGGSAVDLAAADVHEILAMLLVAFRGEPGAVLVYSVGLLTVIAAGSALTVLVKGGTVTTLLDADRRVGPVEQRPVRLSSLTRAAAFRLDRFMAGCGRLFSRYLALALLLGASYGMAAAIYLAAVFWSYRVVSDAGATTGWTMAAAALSGLLVLTVTLVNLLYLLMQIVMAEDDCGLRTAGTRIVGFLHRDRTAVAALFLTLLVVVTFATAASILATAGLGFIGFIPILGLTIFWLQLAAWVARSLLFQYLGLTALAAYAHLYRRSDAGTGPEARRREDGGQGDEGGKVERSGKVEGSGKVEIRRAEGRTEVRK